MAICDNENAPYLDNDTLVKHLEEFENTSIEEERYYFIDDISDQHPLACLFFKTKTPRGAILKIYRYMQKHKIPHFVGRRMEQVSDKIIDLIECEDVDNFKDFDYFCEDFINDYLVSFKSFTLV